MGVSISSKDFSCDLGYGGFKVFRDKVSSMVSKEIEEHYTTEFDKGMFLYGEAREKFFKEYDKKTDKLIKDNKLDLDIAIFLYKSDCDGKLTKKQSKKVYDLIKDCDDNLSYGYSDRPDCATMKDFKQIFGNGSTVKWY